MVFSSLTFVFLFLPVVLLINYLLPKKAQNYWLLIVSLFFYAWGAHNFVLVMILSIILNYCFAIKIEECKESKILRHFWLLLAVVVNLGILFYNKYLNFFTSNLNSVFGDSIVITNIMLPIGISFFTFQALSYVIDVYRGDVKVQKNPFYLGLYIAFFPQLIAGPIIRYHTIAEQIEKRKMTLDRFYNGVRRFISGFAQKILLANAFSVVADEAFSCIGQPENLSITFAWLGAICYSFQILFDFSGYSSMAIGLGKMFGFDFMENFNYPYISKSVSEFWRRWHISLGQFFRDYVYVPMGGSRVTSKFILVRNLFVVWLLTGIWHGASWNFIMWGLGYFLLLTIEKLIMLPRNDWGIISKSLYRCFTLLAVLLGWVLFRADGMHSAFYYVKSMFGLSGNAFFNGNTVRYITNSAVLLVLAVLFSSPVISNTLNYLEKRYRIRILIDLCYIALFLLAVSSLVMGANNPFIYFNF